MLIQFISKLIIVSLAGISSGLFVLTSSMIFFLSGFELGLGPGPCLVYIMGEDLLNIPHWYYLVSPGAVDRKQDFRFCAVGFAGSSLLRLVLVVLLRVTLSRRS